MMMNIDNSREEAQFLSCQASEVRPANPSEREQTIKQIKNYQNENEKETIHQEIEGNK